MLSGFVVSIGRSGQQHSLTTGNQFRKMKTICSTTAPTGEGSNGENAPVRKRRKRVTPSVKTRGHKTVVKAAAASPKVAEATEPKALAGSKPPVSKDAFSGKRFEDLALSLPLKKAILDGLGYVHTTEVQASSLPISLNGKDVLVKAKVRLQNAPRTLPTSDCSISRKYSPRFSLPADIFYLHSFSLDDLFTPS